MGGMARHVFVYGTLRQGQVRDINRLRPAPRWTGYASVAGVLYHLGSYPGLVLGGPAPVRGEVYAILPELERQLDEIEAVWPVPSGEYLKREALVQLDAATGAVAQEAPAVLLCLVYEAAPLRVQGRPRIASGDWLRHTAACD